MTALTILTTEIRQLDGLYSLSDLHKAAGSNKNHQPANFLRLDTTQALIDGIHSSEMRSASKTINGGPNRGTYVCRELVIAYAAWISAAFHLKVIQVFLSQSEPRSLPPKPAESSKRYHYPRSFLEQPYFKSATSSANLSISMLSNTEKFISPLFCLLNELRADGHEVSAPWDEAIAMREAIVRANETLKDIYLKAIRETNMPSKMALRGKR
jgi:hypothetical protein